MPSGHDQHSGVEPEQPDLEAKILLHRPEEDVERPRSTESLR